MAGLAQSATPATWSILNGYETYQAYRDELAETQVRESDFVERLYRVYKMQEYLQTYADVWCRSL